MATRHKQIHSVTQSPPLSVPPDPDIIACVCVQVFWKGPKYESARELMASVLKVDLEAVHDEEGLAAEYVDYMLAPARRPLV